MTGELEDTGRRLEGRELGEEFLTVEPETGELVLGKASRGEGDVFEMRTLDEPTMTGFPLVGVACLKEGCGRWNDGEDWFER